MSDAIWVESWEWQLRQDGCYAARLLRQDICFQVYSQWCSTDTFSIHELIEFQLFSIMHCCCPVLLSSCPKSTSLWHWSLCSNNHFAVSLISCVEKVQHCGNNHSAMFLVPCVERAHKCGSNHSAVPLVPCVKRAHQHGNNHFAVPLVPCALLAQCLFSKNRKNMFCTLFMRDLCW